MPLKRQSPRASPDIQVSSMSQVAVNARERKRPTSKRAGIAVRVSCPLRTDPIRAVVFPFVDKGASGMTTNYGTKGVCVKTHQGRDSGHGPD